MIAPSVETITAQTEEWIKSVVIACNFCPFALQAMRKRSIRYRVMNAEESHAIGVLEEELEHLNSNEEIETTFIIFATGFSNFQSYLELIRSAEKFLRKNNYDGVYQLASFHPTYCFAGSEENDAANYTNRSPYPMLHLLREDSITAALENYPHPESIPDKNIAFSRKKGLEYMAKLRAACMS